MTLIMFALIAVLIIFMIRNGRKRQQAAQEMQSNLRPGAEVMLASGIYGTVEEVDEEANRVTVRTGTSTIVVHRNAVNQIVSPAEPVDEPVEQIAPDDDPEFGERIADSSTEAGEAEAPAEENAADQNTAETDGEQPSGDQSSGEQPSDDQGGSKA